MCAAYKHEATGPKQSPKSPCQAPLGCAIATPGDNKAPTETISVGGLIANGSTIHATPADSGAEQNACGVETLHQLGIDTANLHDPFHMFMF